jgi:hypothetical protein
MRARFRRRMLARVKALLPEIEESLKIEQYKQIAELRIGFGEGGDLTPHPWYVIGIGLEFKHRSFMRFGQLFLMISLNRSGNKYRIRGTIHWAWPLRIKYETGMLHFPLSAVDAKLFDKHLSNMRSVFVSIAKRSLKRTNNPNAADQGLPGGAVSRATRAQRRLRVAH